MEQVLAVYAERHEVAALVHDLEVIAEDLAGEGEISAADYYEGCAAALRLFLLEWAAAEVAIGGPVHGIR